MKTTLALVLAALFATSAAHATEATEANEATPLTSFFSSLEGSWQATGLIHLLDANGNDQAIKYASEIRVEHTSQFDDDTVWAITNQITSDNGTTSQNNDSYIVRGKQLFVSAAGQLEPVQVTESSPFSLTYKMQRADVLTGRVYNFSFHTELKFPGGTLEGHNTVETNGVTITDETFNAKKW